MWKKDETMPDALSEVDAAMRRPEPLRLATPGAGGQAVIGPSITIHGEVSGNEDLLVQGTVDGSLDLEAHAVTVGAEGHVNANITARVITVEGHVEGDLNAKDQVILRSKARVKGDITAPRVVLEDGANFRGLVDMGDAEGRGTSAAAQRPSAESGPGASHASTGLSTKSPESTPSTPTLPGKGEKASETPDHATT